MKQSVAITSRKYLEVLASIEALKEENQFAQNARIVKQLDDILRLLVGVIYQDADKDEKRNVH